MEQRKILLSMKNTRRFVVTLLVLLLCASVRAQSPLLEIPLGIQLGNTKSSELESRGVCVARINSPDSAKTRCIRYNMDNNRFYAHTNFAKIIDRISFQSIAHHQLPDSWKKMGIRLASSYRYRKIKTAQEINSQTLENEGGNSLTEFIQIITSQNAKEITRRVSYKSDYQIGETVEFVIGNYFYMAEFMKWIKPEWCKDCPTYSDYDNGLVSLEITRPF
jgi:hypothetical protein